MNRIGNTLYKATEWITKCALLQVYWLLFTLLGLIFLGFYPATIASFSLVRKWLMGETDLPLFKTFTQYFRTEFLKANLFGLVLNLFIALLLLDFFYIFINQSSGFEWINIPLFAYTLLFTLFTFYLFPVYVHFDQTLGQQFKNAFFIMLLSPWHTMLMLICLSSVSVLIYYLPAIGFIFGVSIYSFITMWFAMHAFRHLQDKNKAS